MDWNHNQDPEGIGEWLQEWYQGWRPRRLWKNITIDLLNILNCCSVQVAFMLHAKKSRILFPFQQDVLDCIKNKSGISNFFSYSNFDSYSILKVVISPFFPE